MTSTMAFAISTPSSSLLHSSSSSTARKTTSHSSFSNSVISIPRNAIFQHIKCIPQLGVAPFFQWNGLRQMGISISQYSVKIERKGKYKGKGVYASLFGVGAPEILVIGVVALLVFGPKGLAEVEYGTNAIWMIAFWIALDMITTLQLKRYCYSVDSNSNVARNLGQTLRAFQPTIRELQEVSREFKSTLEREIGLDDIDNPVPKSSSSNTPKPTSEETPVDSGTNIEPNGSSSENVEDSTDDYLKVKADRFRGALAQLQKEQEEEKEKALSQAGLQTPSQDTPEALDTPQEASSVTPPSENPDNNVLQEAASVGPTDSAPKTENQA
ncbi:hypothetical protein DH2020_031011 [Rehmannia glutinosa]|uniref:Uncharacterized protein n=1 Tax=Rehmannia glutinosa TaxID=99300 RepID=A0ABR0VMA3_REHGL